MSVPSLPNNLSSWKTAFLSENPEDATIHSPKAYNPASKIKLDQFLLLRVLWKANNQTKFKHDVWDIGESAWKDAKKHLRDWTPWEAYIKTVGQHRPEWEPFIDIGTLTSTLRSQDNITATISTQEENEKIFPIDAVSHHTRSRDPLTTPTKSTKTASVSLMQISLHDLKLESDEEESASPEQPSILLSARSPAAAGTAPPVNDEMIVNSSLVEFLDALCRHCENVRAKWTGRREVFRFGTNFEARTDGVLRTERFGIAAILEVKPFLRRHRLQAIQMQEAAQMAAWIFQDEVQEKKPTSKPRLLVSQDHREIYLTFARYTTGYVDYLANKQRKTIKRMTRDQRDKHKSERDEAPIDEIAENDMMEMSQFGPWAINEPDHMKSLGHIILAYTIDRGR